MNRRYFQNEKTGIKHLFQTVFFYMKNFIYALLRLAEKPAINFLKPAILSKKIGLV